MQINKWIRHLRYGLLTVAVGVLMALLPIGNQLEAQYGLNWLFKLRGEIPPPQNVAIIGINRESASALNLPYQADRWPRHTYAQLVHQLTAAGASAIAFDVLFREPRTEAEDSALADAITTAGNVVLLEKLMVERHYFPAQPSAGSQELLVTQHLRPHPRFSGAAATAPFLVPKIPIQVQQTWLYSPTNHNPTLPLAAFQVHRAHQAKNGTRSTATVASLPLQTSSTARYLNFYGPAGSITTINADRVLTDQPLSLSGTAVFVGYAERNTQEQKDHFYTVFSGTHGVDMAGVEIAATAFANLLMDNFVNPLPRWQQLLVLVFWGLVVGSIAFIRSIPIAYTSLTLLLAGYSVISYLLFARHNVWLPLVTPLIIQGSCALLLSMVWRYQVSTVQRQTITKALEPYAPHTVVDELIQTGHRSMGAQRRFGVCIYTDIIKSTRITETLGDELWAEIANEYFDFLFKPAQTRGAVLSDIAGDSMLAYWTATHEDSQMSQTACQAALEIQQIMHQFRHPAFNHPILSRIGVNCGWVREGDTKVGQQLRYGIRGHMVNMAARIEGLNKQLGTQLLVARDALPLDSPIPHLNLGRFTLEGAQSGIEILQIFTADDWSQGPTADIQRSLDHAKRLFSQRNWQLAEAQFMQLQQRWPQWGPPHFYANLCRTFMQCPPDEDWDGSVIVTKS